MAPSLRGTTGDDRLATDLETRRIIGQRGDDQLDGRDHGGGLYGGIGDDTLIGGGPGNVQAHLYGGLGKDVIQLNISDGAAPYGDHAWGGMAEDRFIFTLTPGDSARITGRIDDFDVSRDQIWIDGARLDFARLPANVRVVAHDNQPWLLIDERALYALEGARQFDGIKDKDPSAGRDEANDNGEESHFIDWPAEWAAGVPASADIPYTDFYAFFPKELVALPETGLPTDPFTAGPDYRVGSELSERIIGEDGADTLFGRGGGDLIHGGEQDDVIHGEEGDDSLSGGLDNDRMFGGAGHDILFGGSGEDLLHGGADNDLLRGNNGDDTLQGELGDDTLMGGWGNDSLYGGRGSDVLYASLPQDDPDLPDGGENQLFGDEGNDTLHAAENGETTMVGGAGDDSFLAAPNAEIVISDFQPGEDYLDLAGLSPGDEALEAQLSEQMRENDGANTDLMLVLGGMTTVMFQNLAQVELAELMASIGQTQPIDPPPPDPDDDDGDGDGDGDPPPEEEDEKGDGTCFVATACYGDLWHPDVAWLRGFRDHRLRLSRPGRAFVALYWRFGPRAAGHIKSEGISGALLRGLLGLLVRLGRRRWPDWPQPNG